MEVVNDLERILELADMVSGTSAALSSAEPRSSLVKPEKYAEVHMDDTLAKMRGFAKLVQKKNILAGQPLHQAIKELGDKLVQGISVYRRY